MSRAVVMLGICCLFLIMFEARAELRTVRYENWDDCLELSNAEARLVIAPANGGRIVHYSRNGGPNFFLGGCQIDIGPELDYPPSHQALWTGRYQAETLGPLSVQLTSSKDQATGVQLVKIVELAPVGAQVTLHQTMKNIAAQEVAYCLWDRTMTGASYGFFELNAKSRFPARWSMRRGEKSTYYFDGETPVSPRVKIVDNLLVSIPGRKMEKVATDNVAGWIAGFRDGWLYVKRFPVFAEGDYADGGNSVEIWVDAAGKRTELEPLSPKVKLQPGDSYTFVEKWDLQQVTEVINNAEDIPQLLAHVRKMASPLQAPRPLPPGCSFVGKPGQVARYRHAQNSTIQGSVVETFTLTFGSAEKKDNPESQWLSLRATKANGNCFNVWLLGPGYSAETVAAARKSTIRYILQQGKSMPVEFRDQTTGRAVLPALGGWRYLFPRAESGPPGQDFPTKTKFLGHSYLLESIENTDISVKPPNSKVIALRSDVLIGFPHNTRQKDETRRYDRSDYELVRLTKDDFKEMVEAGINCMRVDAEQAGWVDHLDVFYWGTGGEDVSYPECLYRSNYLGPSLFMDEPAVVTRDHVVRPKLRKDPELRRALTPQMVLEDFRDHFRKARDQGAPAELTKGLAARPDVDLGDMEFLQQNVYSWETMVSSAIHQLSEGKEGPPAAMVFEPPGRFGTRRTLPDMNMTYGCQIPVDDPKNLIEIIYGFLRGAARATDKEWGMSIYGAVDRADTFWFQTHAYDLGATHFFYWDTYELACVPYGECLALSRNLSAHAASHAGRDLERLKRAAEVAILLPPGYNLGHVSMGKGNFWGLTELNLERLNRNGVKYRTVMSNFFIEIERCIRHGVAYDLFWEGSELDLSGYREVVHVRVDGKVEVKAEGQTRLVEGPRTPLRPAGVAPKLTVKLADAGTAPVSLTARARIVEGSAAVYCTLGADARGDYGNVMVTWELYGPGEEDYRFLRQEGWEPRISRDGLNATVEIDFQIERPGTYRLRAATVDMSGRTDVVWKRISVD